MNRVSQIVSTQNNEAVEPSVTLSARALMTGPRQITRLERQFRTATESLQLSLDNLTKTKDSYVAALRAFAEADAYMKQTMPRIKYISSMLANANTYPQYLQEAEAAMQSLVPGKTAEGQSNGMERLGFWDAATTFKNELEKAYNANPAAFENQNSKSPTPATSTPTPATPAATNESELQKAYNTQKVNSMKAQLNAFVADLYRQYNVHKRRAASLGSQYQNSKAAYAKVRASFFQTRDEVSQAHGNLIGWNERLTEYYPSSGEN
jgi:hypothetical protein